MSFNRTPGRRLPPRKLQRWAPVNTIVRPSRCQSAAGSGRAGKDGVQPGARARDFFLSVASARAAANLNRQAALTA